MAQKRGAKGSPNKEVTVTATRPKQSHLDEEHAESQLSPADWKRKYKIKGAKDSDHFSYSLQ